MSTKAKYITGWVLTGIIVLMLVASATDKIRSSEHALEMAGSFGIKAGVYQVLGMIELLSVLLFAIPRTGILGTLLLASYLGGALATHLQHQQSILFPIGIEVLVWITATIRFKELGNRLFHPGI
ncbi:DoxX family protein [Chitinophaga sancti]|uniref:DoxX family protein n=1 Tax=Chitinophaga sancti TaxID=1004 RepID=UPI002A748A55|nr:DoxX family protein [Chitinophaga sancti]WPQ61417.1 DoxX family protein [Chitinophaga sancti]